MLPDKTQIGTLRVRGVSRDKLGLRLSLTNLLNRADLRPTGIPPAAVLIVRRLADPLPRRLAPHRRSVRVDAAWERATRDALSALYRRAVRPNRGYMPAGAEAVRFADEGEMLACLALDVARGKAREHWWWRAILHGVPSPLPAGFTRLLCERAAAVPAALHHLVAWGQAVQVLDALSPSQALAILAAVARAFDVPGLPLASMPQDGAFAASAGDSGKRHSTTRTRGGAMSLPVGTPGARRGTFLAKTLPPWEVELVPPGLEKTRACLLGVGLSLYRRPAMVRDEPFRAALAAWWEGTAVSLPAEIVVEAPSPRVVVEETLSVSPSASPPARTNEAQGEPADRRRVERAIGQSSVDRDSFEVDLQAVAESGHVGEKATPVVVAEDDVHSIRLLDKEQMIHPPPGELEQSGERSVAVVVDLGRDERPLQPVGQLEREEPTVSQVEASANLEGGFYTWLGGVLYLINLMAYLDLPTCFEEDWGLESLVGSWGVLELLGRGLLTWKNTDAPPSRGYKDDPLWTALAQLDSREPGELPGATFPGGECFRLPGDWLAGIGDGEGIYRYAARRGRLRLWSEEGYVLEDVPRDDAPTRAQAKAGLRRYLCTAAPTGAAAPALVRAAFDYAPVTHLAGPLTAGLNPHLARWLGLMLPAICLRLRRALNPSGDGTWNLAESLLLCPGHLYVTSTHVDLVMSLDNISLPVRLAGLDRSPGWMADLGRVVLFHFE